MTQPSVSLIIVSRHRPQALRRCLMAVAQMDHQDFEVIVVADPSGLVMAEGLPVKRVGYDQANISAARNLGLRAAAGEVVAFLDDDAVPEPNWLSQLCAPFEDPQVMAAGGYVLGRNGISCEWAGGTVDRLLVTGDLPASMEERPVHQAQPGLAIEIKGTNAAYRRALLLEMGGFDEEIRYYLDETELNLRLAARAAKVAIPAYARVHHAKEPSAIRKANRAPLSLWDIGASTAITLRRHGANVDELTNARARMIAHQQGRLDGFVRLGRISRGEAGDLMASLLAGFADGAGRMLLPLPAIGATPEAFERFPAGPRPQVVLAGRRWQTRRLLKEASARAARGEIVRLFLFSPTALFHRVRFSEQGFWLQTGGLFGKSLRTDPLFRLWSFAARLSRESGKHRQ